MTFLLLKGSRKALSSTCTLFHVLLFILPYCMYCTVRTGFYHQGTHLERGEGETNERNSTRGKSRGIERRHMLTCTFWGVLCRHHLFMFYRCSYCRVAIICIDSHMLWCVWIIQFIFPSNSYSPCLRVISWYKQQTHSLSFTCMHLMRIFWCYLSPTPITSMASSSL